MAAIEVTPGDLWGVAISCAKSSGRGIAGRFNRKVFTTMYYEHIAMYENGSKVYFRHVNWATDRPRLFDLLRELELNDNLAGVIIWRNNRPYVLAAPALAIGAERLNRACNTDEGITDRQLNRAIMALNDSYDEPNWEINLGELESQTHTNPFDVYPSLSYILDACGLERADHEAILSWIKVKFPKAAEKLAKSREKFKF